MCYSCEEECYSLFLKNNGCNMEKESTSFIPNSTFFGVRKTMIVIEADLYDLLSINQVHTEFTLDYKSVAFVFAFVFVVLCAIFYCLRTISRKPLIYHKSLKRTWFYPTFKKMKKEITTGGKANRCEHEKILDKCDMRDVYKCDNHEYDYCVDFNNDYTWVRVQRRKSSTC